MTKFKILKRLKEYEKYKKKCARYLILALNKHIKRRGETK